MFDLTVVTLETASETRTLDINRQAQDPSGPRQYPPAPVPDAEAPNTPQNHPYGGHHPVGLRPAPNGAVVAGDIGADLVVSGQAGREMYQTFAAKPKIGVAAARRLSLLKDAP